MYGSCSFIEDKMKMGYTEEEAYKAERGGSMTYDELKEENTKLRKALDFYADRSNYEDECPEHGHNYHVPEILHDNGTIARESLLKW